MFFHLKCSQLWIFVFVLTLSEAATFDGNITFAEAGVCDEDCLISKSNFHLKNDKELHRSNRQTCSLQGIDTSASDEQPFKLFGSSNDEYHIEHLTRSNGTCDCSKSIHGKKHAVVKKEINGKILLTDVYVSCGEENEDDDVLEGLIFDYIKNVPERTLGSKPELENGDENCLDENGFITPKLPGEIPCFSYILAFSNGTYSSTNQLLEVNVNYYSGPFSVNRIDQSENVTHESLATGKSSSMLALYYTLQQTCDISELDSGDNNHCHSYFNNAIYSFICCCNKKPGQCSFRRYKEKSLICAVGNYSMVIGAEPQDPIAERALVRNLKNDLANKTFCSSKYTFTNKMIKYVMPAPNFSKCNAGEGDKGYCTLDNDVCPSDEQNPSVTTITCCCRKPDLCNVDFVALKAVDRFEFMIKNKVCDQPMLYSVLFARTNYTLFEDHKQPLCYIHYDVNHPSARYFLANNNLDLLRDVDYLAYQKEGCNVIAAKIRPVVPEKCPKENYSFDDTKLPRPLFLCTCNGSKIDTETTKDTKFCDAELKDNINNTYNGLKDKLMPKCFVTKNPIKSFDESVSFDAILKSGTINMITKSIFCYMEVTKDSDMKENDEINFSLTAGIASLENGYGEKCYNLYQKKQKNGESTEKAFCDFPKNNKTICCMIGMEKEPVELLDEIQEKVVEQKAIRDLKLIKKYYQKQRSLKCRTSKHTKEFGKECKHPNGCFWTDSSTGEVKTTSVAGCIDTIPKLLEKNSSNPIYRSLQTCLTISRMRRLKKLDEKEKLKEPYRCFATNEINYPDEKDQLTNVFVVCCCTEIDENGRCDRKDNAKKSYGAKVIDVGNNKISKQHKNQIYSVPI